MDGGKANVYMKQYSRIKNQHHSAKQLSIVPQGNSLLVYSEIFFTLFQNEAYIHSKALPNIDTVLNGNFHAELDVEMIASLKHYRHVRVHILFSENCIIIAFTNYSFPT